MRGKGEEKWERRGKGEEGKGRGKIEEGRMGRDK